MTQDPSTGAGYEAVEVDSQEYFDPNATDDAFPGDMGLQIRQKTYWQGDVVFHTSETVGPVYGPAWPQGTLKAGGLGVDASVWGLRNQAPPPLGVVGNSGIPGFNVAPGVPGGLAPVTAGDGDSLNPEIPCDPDDIFGPLFGESVNEIKILLQGVYGVGDLYFPVPPEELSGDFPQDNDGDTDTLAGEITIPGTEKLESIGWTSFFPLVYNDTFCVVAEGEMPDPMEAIVGLIWSKRFRLPLNLIITGTPWHDTVIIKTLKWTYKAGEPGDIYYDIQFKRFRSVSISTVVLPNAKVDPRDYPGYQGPPPQAFVSATFSEQARDKWGNEVGDGTTNATVADPPVQSGPSMFLNPATGNYEPLSAPGATPGVFITATPSTTKTIITTYPVGLAVNWRGNTLVGGQTLRQVYEDVKSKSSKNTLEILMEMNKDVSAENFPLGVTAFATKHKLSDYNPNFDPLPLGTPIKYYKVVPANATINENAGDREVSRP